MAVTTENNRTDELTCDGIVTDFDFSMLIYDESEVEVWYEPDAGRYEQLTLNTDYGVVFTDDGGTISTDGYTAPLAAGKLLIIRHLALTQQTNWLYNDNHTGQQHQDDFDRPAIRDIQLQEAINRCPKFLTTSGTMDITFPEPVANELIGWNAGGTDLANISPATFAVLVAEWLEGIVLELTDLTDITIDTPVDGDLLRYDGAMWANDPYTNIDHDQLTNFLAAEHYDWTNETHALLTTNSLKGSKLILTIGSEIEDDGAGYTCLSGDGAVWGGLSIGIPQAAGSQFYYGYGGTEDHIFGQAGIELIIFSDGALTTLKDITARNYYAANKLTACATNAGALDFSAASKTLTIEDNAIVSQDYSSDGSPTFNAITGTSFIIGGNTLTTTEWAYLDGLDQALKTTDSPQFATLGVGAAADSTAIINAQQATQTGAVSYGMLGGVTNIKDSGLGQPQVFGLNFYGKFQPLSPSTNRTAAQVVGCYAYGVMNNNSADKTLTVTDLIGIKGYAQVSNIGGGGSTATSCSIFYAEDPANADTITNLRGLYLEEMTEGGTNWQIYSVAGASYFGGTDGLYLGQTGGAEKISSSQDGYMNYAAGTVHQFDSRIEVTGDVRVTAAVRCNTFESHTRPLCHLDLGTTEHYIYVYSNGAGTGNPLLIGSADGTSDWPLLWPGATSEGRIGSTGRKWKEVWCDEINVTNDVKVGGVLKVDNVQVVANRIIDARCNDAINSGDATTDGVIDSLRDAMITHGLIAAA